MQHLRKGIKPWPTHGYLRLYSVHFLMDNKIMKINNTIGNACNYFNVHSLMSIVNLKF